MRHWLQHLGQQRLTLSPAPSPRSGVNGDLPERVTRVALPRPGALAPSRTSSAVQAAEEASTPP